MADVLPPRTEILDLILDRVHPPVARFRVISSGLAKNHTLKTGDDISGTRACLACGNCVDACPVVATKPEGTMFVRTSMLLENVVSEECRRCYKCVASCPQVSSPVKDYVRGYRRVERTSHWTLLASYLILMTTGILINHWGSELPPDLRTIAGIVHRIFTVFLVAAPILWIIFDRHHFLMAMRNAFSWSGKDLLWARNTADWITSWGRKGSIKRGAFNPGQRFWYLYVPFALTVFVVTGTIKWLGPDVVGQQLMDAATAVHVTIALSTDILLLLHVYLKLGLPIIRDAIRGARQYFEIQEHRRTVSLPRGK